MIKMCMCVKRLPEISYEAFADYWQNRHAPLVAELHDALGIIRYTQTLLLPDAAVQQTLLASRGAQPYPFDGLGEVWWHDLAQMRAARNTPAAQAAAEQLYEDERRFVCHGRSYLWLAEERIIL